MIPYNLKINGKKQEFEIPVSWNEISYFQAIALSEMEDHENNIDLVHILSGIPSGILGSMSEKVFNKVLGSCMHVFTDEQPDFSNLPIPSKIKVRGKDYSTSINTTEILAGSMWSIQEGFRGMDEGNVAKNLHTIIAHALAGQIFKDASGKPLFDSDKIDMLAIEIGNMSAVQIYPVGSFFLRELSIHLMTRQASLEKILLKKRNRQAQESYNSLGLFSRFKRYVMGIGQRRNSTNQRITA